MKRRSGRYRLNDRILAEVRICIDLSLGDLDPSLSLEDRLGIRKKLAETLHTLLSDTHGLNPTSYNVKIIEATRNSELEETEDGFEDED